MESTAFEKHYRVKELAGLWRLSPKTVSRIFAGEAGVIRISNGGTSKRKYATLSIPESVALRVHDKLGKQLLQEAETSDHTVRIIRLRDMDSRVPDSRRIVVKPRGPKTERMDAGGIA